MLMPKAAEGFLSTHTFGRNMQVQQVQLPPSQPVGGSAQLASPQLSGRLPDNFDQMVRNVGEW